MDGHVSFDKPGRRIKTALSLCTLCGNPAGINGVGPAFFGDFLSRLTKRYPPREGGTKLAAPDAKPVNNPSYLHSHTKREYKKD